VIGDRAHPPAFVPVPVPVPGTTHARARHGAVRRTTRHGKAEGDAGIRIRFRAGLRRTGPFGSEENGRPQLRAAAFTFAELLLRGLAGDRLV